MTDFTQFTPEVVTAALEKLNKLFVYEVKEYEEYAAQVDKGIYATPERAIEAAKDCIRRQYETRDKGPVPPISVIKYEGLTSNDWLVLTGDWTEESFAAWREVDSSGYWWYHPPFNHVGVVAVFETEVIR